MLRRTDVMQEDVYNMDKTGVMLSKPGPVKVSVSDNARYYSLVVYHLRSKGPRVRVPGS